MKRNLYSKEEVILCTFLAKFGKQFFDENDIQRLNKRSISSIKMKVMNIAAMLSEEGFEVNNNISTLSGKTTGEKGRKTNWDIVMPLTTKGKQEFLGICQKIITIDIIR